jgi:hypothetical protein
MFGPYFAPTYFAPTYFPPGVAGLVDLNLCDATSEALRPELTSESLRPDLTSEPYCEHED